MTSHGARVLAARLDADAERIKEHIKALRVFRDEVSG